MPATDPHVPSKRGSVALLLDSLIYGYLDRIGRCDRSSQVADVLAREATRMGLSAVACLMLTGPKAASRNPFYANNWPRPWLDVYERQGFMGKDPFARWAISSGAPVSWATLLKRLPPNDPAHAMKLAARNFGFREGFGTPVRSAAGHLGLFTFFGDRRPLTMGEQIFLQAICPGTLHRMEALAPIAEPARPAGLLSLRERECVALLCEGLSNGAIADRLGITVATVKFHLANACAKLGARSRAQLASLFRAAPQPLSSPSKPPDDVLDTSPEAGGSGHSQAPHLGRNAVVQFSAPDGTAHRQGRDDPGRDRDGDASGVVPYWEDPAVASAGAGHRWANW